MSFKRKRDDTDLVYTDHKIEAEKDIHKREILDKVLYINILRNFQRDDIGRFKHICEQCETVESLEEQKNLLDEEITQLSLAC